MWDLIYHRCESDSIMVSNPSAVKKEKINPGTAIFRPNYSSYRNFLFFLLSRLKKGHGKQIRKKGYNSYLVHYQ
jgi:hypothetical protein